MEFLELPNTTQVNRVVPKNAFDSYTNTKQKKLFTDIVNRIVWTHKLSPDTLNLDSKEIKEIQLFKVDLKVQKDVKEILDIIDKAIPYHIIFIIQFGDQTYLSTSSKHPHPVNENNAIIDWTFRSAWMPLSGVGYRLNLKGSLDAIYKDLCLQLSGKPELSSKPLNQVIEIQQKIQSLTREIEKLKSKIRKTKQFNKKVELNMVLREKEVELEKLNST